MHRYYWPDAPPYASMLRTIVDAWTDHGHEVEVLSTQPSYKAATSALRRPRVEVLDRARVRRLPVLRNADRGWRKAANMVVFPLLVFGRVLLGRRPQVVMCSTAPPVTLGFAAALAATCRRARFVYHCMDIHPEIGALSGDFANPLVYRVLLRIDRFTCRRAAAVVVLSDEMRRALLDRGEGTGAGADRIVVLNNFELAPADAGPDGAIAADVPPRNGAMRIAFTGNVGRFQGLDTVVEAVARTPGVELVLMGEGSAVAELRTLVTTLGCGDRVHFLPHSSVGEARALMRDADLGLVSLAPGIIRYAFPSKTMTYLAEGLPLLALVETDSQLAGLVRRERVGFACEPGDAEGLATILRQAAADRGELHGARARARAVGIREFGVEQARDRWVSLLDRVTAA